ncbi:MAG TPA: hypothetical protein PLH11_10170 [Gemmobacter sp.]|nr:hypothetical protein [Gemmobacter sp.]
MPLVEAIAFLGLVFLSFAMFVIGPALSWRKAAMGADMLYKPVFLAIKFGFFELMIAGVIEQVMAGIVDAKPVYVITPFFAAGVALISYVGAIFGAYSGRKRILLNPPEVTTVSDGSSWGTYDGR